MFSKFGGRWMILLPRTPATRFPCASPLVVIFASMDRSVAEILYGWISRQAISETADQVFVLNPLFVQTPGLRVLKSRRYLICFFCTYQTFPKWTFLEGHAHPWFKDLLDTMSQENKESTDRTTPRTTRHSGRSPTRSWKVPEDQQNERPKLSNMGCRQRRTHGRIPGSF